VIDLGSRRVVGWATVDHLRTDLIEQALRNAIAQRRPEPGVIFHSDRGWSIHLQPVRTSRCGRRSPVVRRS
jgi:transposase InsO family protein